MDKKLLIKIFLFFLIFISVLAILFIIKNRKNEEKKNEIINESVSKINNESTNIIVDNNKNDVEEKIMDTIQIKVNNNVLNVKLEDNSSSKALVEKLKDGDVVVNAQDYGNFEKVGSLGFSLPTNDENITTQAGDLILYQGNQITLYYDTNSWMFTKLGRVQGVSDDELKQILGNGNVTLIFTLGN